jgi:hypothetical protein
MNATTERLDFFLREQCAREFLFWDFRAGRIALDFTSHGPYVQPADSHR